jgi:hypothetical protein
MQANVKFIINADENEVCKKVTYENCTVLGTKITPPSTPQTGDKYFVGVGATGAWLGQDGNLALWNGAAWDFIIPSQEVILNKASIQTLIDDLLVYESTKIAQCFLCSDFDYTDEKDYVITLGVTDAQRVLVPYEYPPASGKFYYASRQRSFDLFYNISDPPVIGTETDPSTLTPVLYDKYLIGVGAVGVWAGKDGEVAIWNGSIWLFEDVDPDRTVLTDAQKATILTILNT